MGIYGITGERERWGQELIDRGMAESETQEGRVGRRRRKWMMEGSPAKGANLHALA